MPGFWTNLVSLGRSEIPRDPAPIAATFDVAFFLRATPVSQVREIAAAGVNMPPKSTFFFPKVPTGLLVNPLL